MLRVPHHGSAEESVPSRKPIAATPRTSTVPSRGTNATNHAHSTNGVVAADRHHEDRARAMGRRRGKNDAGARSVADACDEAEQARRAVCLQRWPGIVTAIRSLVAAYNDGAGAELLTANEQSGNDAPAVTITSRGSARTLTIGVDEDALLVHTNLEPHAAASLHAIPRRIDCSRNDTGTAAYALQDWMVQL